MAWDCLLHRWALCFWLGVRNGIADLGVYPVEVLRSSQWKKGQRSEVLFHSLWGYDAENRQTSDWDWFFYKVECAHILYIVRKTHPCILCRVGTITGTSQVWWCPLLFHMTDYLLGLLPQDRVLIFSANKALQCWLKVSTWYASCLSIPKWALKQPKRNEAGTDLWVGIKRSSVVTDSWSLANCCNTGGVTIK